MMEEPRSSEERKDERMMLDTVTVVYKAWGRASTRIF
jgi:hypothetical protein